MLLPVGESSTARNLDAAPRILSDLMDSLEVGTALLLAIVMGAECYNSWVWKILAYIYKRSARHLTSASRCYGESTGSIVSSSTIFFTHSYMQHELGRGGLRPPDWNKVSNRHFSKTPISLKFSGSILRILHTAKHCLVENLRGQPDSLTRLGIVVPSVRLPPDFLRLIGL